MFNHSDVKKINDYVCDIVTGIHALVSGHINL